MTIGRACLALAAVLLALAPAAVADESVEVAPDAVAWWHVGPLPALAGLATEEGQILVEGLGDEEAGRQAVAGLAFTVKGRAGPLVIPVVSSSPEVAVRVCAATAGFDSVSGGAAEDVPSHDCDRSTVTTPAGGLLTVEDLGPLARRDTVAVVLVPAAPGRLVLDGVAARLHESPPLEPAAGAGRPDAPVAASPPSPAEPPPAVDVPGVVAPPVGSGDPGPSEQAVPPPPRPAGGEAGRVVSSYVPAGDGTGSRGVTAAVVGVSLAGLMLLTRNGSSRLRPARVAWRSGEPGE